VLAKPIYNITPFTLLDYPNHSACIFWYAGCNMRCSYCYNPEIVLGKGKITFPEAISFLNPTRLA
jgi:pyruvate formate lyase activating enzyme